MFIFTTLTQQITQGGRYVEKQWGHQGLIKNKMCGLQHTRF